MDPVSEAAMSWRVAVILGIFRHLIKNIQLIFIHAESQFPQQSLYRRNRNSL